MPKVSINILTKNRAALLKKALDSIAAQTFKDYEVVVVNDGSTDDSAQVLADFKQSIPNLKVITHQSSSGITLSRQEALLESAGDYITVLDDDDEWIDPEKLRKQAEFLDNNPHYVLLGGGITLGNRLKLRPQSDQKIRRTMLFRNNFFTSTVMFRKSAAIEAGGFIKDGDDFTEDYDLWLRLGQKGIIYNFQQAFAAYRVPVYNKGRFKAFLSKQLRLINREKAHYPGFWLAAVLLRLRAIL